MSKRKDELPKELFRTGYVIEMAAGRYFSGWKNGTICCLSLEQARYFPTLELAKRYVYRKLYYIGIRLHICQVCWTLCVMDVSGEGTEPVKNGQGESMKFFSYTDARNYQKERKMEENSMVDLYAFRKIEVSLAA